MPFIGRSRVGLEAWVCTCGGGGSQVWPPLSGVLWPPGGAGLPGNLGGGRSIRTQLTSKGRQSGNWKVAHFSVVPSPIPGRQALKTALLPLAFSAQSPAVDTHREGGTPTAWSFSSPCAPGKGWAGTSLSSKAVSGVGHMGTGQGMWAWVASPC